MSIGQTANGQPQPPKNGFISDLQGDAYTKLNNSAFNKDENPWAKLAVSRQQKVLQDATEKGAQQTAGQTAGAQSALAMHGGLTSGARERTVEGGQTNYMNMAQGLERQSQENNMNIGIEDAKDKMQQQGQVTGLEMQDNTARNAYNENLYNQQMQAWAAKQQADATRDSGKGGK